MPLINSAFVRATALLLVSGILILLGIVGTSFWLVERTQALLDQAAEARGARNAAIALRTDMLDAEVGQRGYLLTLDEDYLAPFETGMSRIEPGLADLWRAIAPFPEFRPVFEALRVDIAAKRDELAETVALARSGRVEEARAIVVTDFGQETMDEARAYFDTVIAAAERRLTDAIDAERHNTGLLRLANVIGAIAILLVIGGSFWIIVRHTRDIVTARRFLEDANALLEERVDERTTELVRANEEVQRFAYIVTHDLRAPLVNVMGFTSELDAALTPIRAALASEGTPDAATREAARLAAEEDLPEAIGFIRSSTRKMDGLINAILKISRDGRRPLRPETLSLSELLSATAETVQHQVGETGGSVSVSSRLPNIVSDRLAIEQIFGNLLDNAVKYRDLERPLKIAITGGTAPGGRAYVEVEDNGRGIAPEDHERVFELFRRSGAQTAPGEGIGLAHVRSLVRNLGGDITLRSELGQGTVFRVLLARDLRPIVSASKDH